MKKLIHQLKYYFSFTKRERRGIIVLFSLMLLLLIIRMFIFPYLTKNQHLNIDKFSKEITAFESYSDSAGKAEHNKSYSDNQKFDFNNSDKSFAAINLKPFEFNPNTIQTDEMKEMGLSDKQIKTLLNFRNKGGKFYKKEDFKKMYCISSEEYNILEPFISIPDNRTNSNTSVKYENKQKAVFTAELNSADTNDLQEIKGIGPAFARRIANYRNKLGGFVKKEQLREVYGIDSAKYAMIQASVTINASAIQKININKASIQELKKHPYFDYYVAKAIVSYRTLHGEFKSVSEIRKVNLVYDDFYNKIAPYLSVN
ncbi:MAG: helix-hairpin-helix domain-containing protein [Bacteroidetes bacterium]|nr:helix-hairpin-helix domain-containing protein [Bacteroidota bacterium]